MRTVKTMHLPNGYWLTTINLWICDESHSDTCHYSITQCKPTGRQVRKLKKIAKLYFRHGTRKQQRDKRLKRIAP